MSKTQRFIALALVLIGTNILTYATTRHLVTQAVLIRAEHRMESALRELGAFEDLSQRGGAGFQLAIPMAGGRYYWWNDGLMWWGMGLFFLVGAALVSRVRLR